MPSRNFFRDNIIPDIYNRICEKIKLNLKDCQYVSLTSDIWTCKNTNISFISITGHWITSDWNKKNAILNCESFEGSHTGMSIAEKILKLLNTWHISKENIHLMIRDSGANMIRGCKDADISSASCFIHTLQLVILDSIKTQRAISDMIAVAKRIATHFNHSSLACDKLKKIQEEYNLPQKKVVQDVSTRWNSTYYMLERLQDLKRSITIYCADAGENLNFTSLTNNQWELLNSTLKLLRPFEEVTRTVSSTESIISDVIPIVAALKKKLSIDSDIYGVGTTKEALLENITRRFENIEKNEHYMIATVLDPRYKLAFFSDCNLIKQIVLNKIETSKNIERSNDMVASRLEREASSEDSEGEDDYEPLSKVAKREESLWKCFDSIASATTSNSSLLKSDGTIEEFENYLREPLQERLSDPLVWWKDHQFVLPNLTKISKQYLSAPASSVYSERSFSEMGNIYEEKRSRLTPQNAEKLLFIHHNLKKINIDY